VVSLHGAEVEAGAVRVELNIFEPGVRQATICMHAEREREREMRWLNIHGGGYYAYVCTA
jgi:hypothetical protein